MRREGNAISFIEIFDGIDFVSWQTAVKVNAVGHGVLIANLLEDSIVGGGKNDSCGLGTGHPEPDLDNRGEIIKSRMLAADIAKICFIKLTNDLT